MESLSDHLPYTAPVSFIYSGFHMWQAEMYKLNAQF